MDLQQFRTRVHEQEVETLARHQVQSRLSRVCSTLAGVRGFAVAFYPLRYSFVQMAFVAGARAPMHEDYWCGLAQNLFEEAGEGHKASHNELYRRFLSSSGLDATMQVPVTDLSRRFNRSWFDYVREAPIDQAIAAIAIYEVIDSPDYRLLYDALRSSSIPLDLKFFEVHASAEHFGMFARFFHAYLRQDTCSLEDFLPVAHFVLGLQEEMWIALLASLEEGRTMDDLAA
jgi:hypothetical protein